MGEIDRMLKWCKDNSRDRDYMLFLTLARTGRRISEVVGKPPYNRCVGLRPIDVFDDDLIEWDILKKAHIKRKTKKGKPIMDKKLYRLRLEKLPRRVLKPVDSQFMEILRDYISELNIGKYDRLFKITRQRAYQILRVVSKGAGVERPGMNIHLHMFRHSLAINMLKDNPHNPYILLQVNKILDHSNINMTAHYAQFTPEDIKQSLNKLFGGEDDTEI